jgi:UDP-N-acetylmuramoyl-tripeptide--D-alanyl-D-alanine ligase
MPTEFVTELLEQPARRSAPYRMPLFTVEEVLEITSGRLLSSISFLQLRSGIRRLSTDTRDIGPGDLFVALKGERFDGRAFVGEAIKRGAIGAIMQGPGWTGELPAAAGRSASRRGSSQAAVLIGVQDTLLAYQQLAAWHRNRFHIPLVAVTGSNGKTTTKEMVARVLAEQGTVLKTEGNLNNRIGVPQTLLGLTRRHRSAVIEMGVDQKGQTARLCEIAHPTIGLITNIGPDHLEFFGSMEASAQAKGELLDHLPSDGAVVLNADDAYFEYLASRAGCRVVSFGLSAGAQVRATDVSADPRRGVTFRLHLPGGARDTKVILPAHGLHNLSNALAAAAVGHVQGMSGTTIARGLARFKPAAMRSQVLTARGIRIVNDSYNANPASMKAAISLLADLADGGRMVAVLGDMLELGSEEHALHREVGAYLATRGISALIACGRLARSLAEGAREAGMAASRVHEVADSIAAAEAARKLVRAGDVVLVKGSRGMKMERVVEALTERKS